MITVMIEGKRLPSGHEILFNGKTLDPAYSQSIHNHSPDGFSYGYSGSGPAQLALAIMLEAGAPVEDALMKYQDFKRDVIARLPDFFILIVEFDDNWKWVAHISG